MFDSSMRSYDSGYSSFLDKDISDIRNGNKLCSFKKGNKIFFEAFQAV